MKPITRQSCWRLLLLLIISSLLISGCGFKLRNHSPDISISSIKQINLDCPKTKSWELCKYLRQQFKLQGIEISKEAEFTLLVSAINKNVRTLSLQQNSSAAEYGLSASVSYQLINTAKDLVIAKNTISRSHSYRHESSALLAKERERIEVQTELSHLLADIIYREVCILNPSANQTPTDLHADSL